MTFMAEYKQVQKSEILMSPAVSGSPGLRGDEANAMIDNLLQVYHIEAQVHSKLHVQHVSGGIGDLLLRLTVEPGQLRIRENPDAHRWAAEAVRMSGFEAGSHGYNSIIFSYRGLGTLQIWNKL